MKVLFTILFCLACSVTSFGQDNINTITSIRNELFYKDFDQDQTISFYKKVYGITESYPLIKAYQAVAEALMAKRVWSPFHKITHLKASKLLFIEAITEDPANLEIRFLRFNTEYYIPSILGMSNHIHEDKQVIMENLKSLDKNEFDEQLTNFIIEFMAETRLCSAKELDMIKNILNKDKTSHKKNG